MYLISACAILHFEPDYPGVLCGLYFSEPMVDALQNLTSIQCSRLLACIFSILAKNFLTIKAEELTPLLSVLCRM